MSKTAPHLVALVAMAALSGSEGPRTAAELEFMTRLEGLFRLWQQDPETALLWLSGRLKDVEDAPGELLPDTPLGLEALRGIEAELGAPCLDDLSEVLGGDSAPPRPDPPGFDPETGFEAQAAPEEEADWQSALQPEGD